MPDTEVMLTRYGEALEAHLLSADDADAREVVLRPHRPPRRRATWLAAAAAVVVLLGGAIVLRSDDRPGREVATASTPSTSASAPTPGEGLFPEPTGLALVFSDGIDGATVVDLDAAVGARVPLDGERAGDQPVRLILTGGHLVVGWGVIRAVPLAGGPSRPIDEATIALPAAEEGEVWTLTWPSGGMGSGPAEVRRVRLDGTVVEEGTLDTDLYEAVLGVPGGLLVRTTDGSGGIWTPSAGAPVVPLLGTVGAATSSGALVASCGASCADLAVGGLPETGPATAPHIAPGLQSIAFAPDGRHLALLRPDGDGQAVAVTDVVTTIDDSGLGLRSEEGAVVSDRPEAHGALQWDPTGERLLYTARTLDESQTIIGLYDTTTQTWQEVVVPLRVGGADGALVVDRDDVAALLAGDAESAGDCPLPTGYPSGRTEPCSFPLTGERPPGPCATQGRDAVVVPDVVGLTEAEAAAALAEAGLVVRGEASTSETEPKVLAQEPPAGTRVPRGACVGLRTG